jgi:hypothetical protein
MLSQALVSFQALIAACHEKICKLIIPDIHSFISPRYMVFPYKHYSIDIYQRFPSGTKLATLVPRHDNQRDKCNYDSRNSNPKSNAKSNPITKI